VVTTAKGNAIVFFRMPEHQVKLRGPCRRPRHPRYSRQRRDPQTVLEQFRQKWRAMLLLIKGRL
jgi:hypothetical protein